MCPSAGECRRPCRVAAGGPDRETKMQQLYPGLWARAALTIGAAIILTLGSASWRGAGADETGYVMKISLPTLNDSLHQYAKNYAAAVAKDSGGRIKPEVYPASQLGSIQR